MSKSERKVVKAESIVCPEQRKGMIGMITMMTYDDGQIKYTCNCHDGNAHCLLNSGVTYHLNADRRRSRDV
jgi:hypothetical protein